MAVITVTNLKGGSSKSTTVINLAVCFTNMSYSVIIVDIDKNNSSIHWSKLRPSQYPKVDVVGFDNAKALRENINSLIYKYEIVLIDGTPDLSPVASSIMLLADLIIIPVKVGVLDIWSTNILYQKYINTKALNKETRAYFLLNQVHARAKMTNEAITALGNFNLKILDSMLHNRIAFSETIKGGIGVYEYTDSKAKNEVINLTNEILSILKEK